MASRFFALFVAAMLCVFPPSVAAFRKAPPARNFVQHGRNTHAAVCRIMMSKVRGYYTVSEENGNGWNLFQDAIEGAVFLGNRGARRRFTVGFSSGGGPRTSLAPQLKPSDRTKLSNHLQDLQDDHRVLKKEIEKLEKLRGAHHLHSCDVKIKGLKKKKLVIKVICMHLRTQTPCLLMRAHTSHSSCASIC
jgi:hypothetical protein